LKPNGPQSPFFYVLPKEHGESRTPLKEGLPSGMGFMLKGIMKDFFFTLLAWLLTLPFIVAAVGFAVYNPAIVSVTFSPFQSPVDLPVYVPVLSAIGFGFMFGAVMTWAAMGRLRKQRREQAKKIRSLEKQLQGANSHAPVRHNYAVVPAALLEKH
jgi:uncharacterized integral membrane protein